LVKQNVDIVRSLAQQPCFAPGMMMQKSAVQSDDLFVARHTSDVSLHMGAVGVDIGFGVVGGGGVGTTHAIDGVRAQRHVQSAAD
jgi:hypothetical protein